MIPGWKPTRHETIIVVEDRRFRAVVEHSARGWSWSITDEGGKLVGFGPAGSEGAAADAAQGRAKSCGGACKP